jgi:uncharacterized protein
MRVGLVSDTHGDPTAWEKALDAWGTLDLVLHAGDVLYHGIFNPIVPTYEPRRLAELLNACPFMMLHARGNCDSEVDQLALDSFILSDFAFVSAEGTRVLVCHGHKWTEEELSKMAAGGKADMVLRGHTHVPEMKVVGGVPIVNVGSCGLPKQGGEKKTVGLLEDRVITVIETETGETFARWTLP